MHLSAIANAHHHQQRDQGQIDAQMVLRPDRELPNGYLFSAVSGLVSSSVLRSGRFREDPHGVFLLQGAKIICAGIRSVREEPVGGNVLTPYHESKCGR